MNNEPPTCEGCIFYRIDGGRYTRDLVRVP